MTIRSGTFEIWRFSLEKLIFLNSAALIHAAIHSRNSNCISAEIPLVKKFACNVPSHFLIAILLCQAQISQHETVFLCLLSLNGARNDENLSWAVGRHLAQAWELYMVTKRVCVVRLKQRW